ncbi:hypothetical protein AGMMS49925_00350 [Deltaproteobacteria bacterium]|nr:hypothetical protein AGMMS49925_00350 [Deltaproteobacteria bacterium]
MHISMCCNRIISKYTATDIAYCAACISTNNTTTNNFKSSDLITAEYVICNISYICPIGTWQAINVNSNYPTTTNYFGGCYRIVAEYIVLNGTK